MIADFFMLLIITCIGTIIIGVSVPLIVDKTYGSRFAVTAFIAVIIILCFLSVNTHNCKSDYVSECNEAHKLNLTFNYCTGELTLPNFTIDSGIYCNYHPSIDCKNIPNECIKDEDKYIDGYCIPLLPFKICALFNKRSGIRFNFTELETVMNWTEPIPEVKNESNLTATYNVTYFVPRYNINSHNISWYNHTVIYNRTTNLIIKK
jgi:hypothetical protein